MSRGTVIPVFTFGRPPAVAVPSVSVPAPVPIPVTASAPAPVPTPLTELRRLLKIVDDGDDGSDYLCGNDETFYVRAHDQHPDALVAAEAERRALAQLEEAVKVKTLRAALKALPI